MDASVNHRGFARLLIFAAVCIVVGIEWDISWHQTIGRDSFWTPAHMAIYLGGLTGGLVGGWLVLRSTFGGSEALRGSTIRLWGMRGPFGAWVAVWGAIAMLTSAPFDDWWHNAYGLDVKILSPPHTVLALGMWAIVLAAFFLMLREQNAETEHRIDFDRLLLVLGGGILLVMASTFKIEKSFPNMQHQLDFYRISSVTYPFYLIALGRACRLRFGATAMAATYMLIFCLFLWILPFFAGEPKLGPVYNRVDRFVPLPFPHLLIVPAIAFDLLRIWLERERGWWRDWVLAFACGIAFTVLFTATQWNFSEFLISEHAQNWFFGADRIWGYDRKYLDYKDRFWGADEFNLSDPAVRGSMIRTLFVATISSRMGLWMGNWMRRLRR